MFSERSESLAQQRPQHVFLRFVHRALQGLYSDRAATEEDACGDAGAARFA